MGETRTFDIRGQREAPPYLEDEYAEICWLRADLALTEDAAREHVARLWELAQEDANTLALKLVTMKPDEADTFNERWILCPEDGWLARYWQVSFE
jgi:hypothetical protein